MQVGFDLCVASTHRNHPTYRDLTKFHGIIHAIRKEMRRKRLQHVADTMCQMFCGWRLIGSKRSLVNMGASTLEIDVITGKGSFQGESIRQLAIAEEIRRWMHDDLAANKISVTALTHALLSVNLFFSEGPNKMYRWQMESTTNAATETAEYLAQLTEVQDRPF